MVDVTNFTPKTDYQGSRENLHLVERWRRVDAETLEYIVTMNDPTTWTAPWTVALELSRQSDQLNRIYKEPRCHEGNYGMPALLRGSRAEEQAFADGTGPDPATLCSAGVRRVRRGLRRLGRRGQSAAAVTAVCAVKRCRPLSRVGWAASGAAGDD